MRRGIRAAIGILTACIGLFGVVMAITTDDTQPGLAVASGMLLAIAAIDYHRWRSHR